MDTKENVTINMSGTRFEVSEETWLTIKSNLYDTHGPEKTSKLFAKKMLNMLDTDESNRTHDKIYLDRRRRGNDLGAVQAAVWSVLEEPSSGQLAKDTSQLYKTTKAGDLFFERHPSCFPVVLGYFQNRGLHMPSSLCPSEFNDEMEFWGIRSDKIAKCCYSRYVAFFDDQNVLKILDQDQMARKEERKEIERRQRGAGWRALEANVWSVLEEPSSSTLAKIYFYVSTVFVVVSISALVSGTHKTFKRPLNLQEWHEFFGDEFDLYKAHFDGSDLSNTTVPPLPKTATHLDFLVYLEYVTVTFFTIELIMRIIFCPFKRKFFLSFLNLVDIFALLVMYSKYVVNAISPKEKYQASVFDIVHCLQIVRVFRLFRLVKNYIGFRVLLYSVKASAKEVMLMSMFLVVAMLMFGAFAFFSGDTVFESIPDAFWWAVVTMTTVGYGDVYPTIGLSKLVGAVCAVTGVCLLAVIIPIFVNNFLLFYAYSKVWGSSIGEEEKRKTSVSPIAVNLESSSALPEKDDNN
ncbi:potassium voltage-gated channel protein egl-36-like [Pecten maximus]|uniref:potassium voltage-gated channel protein egl-36-like n=1 Tax=Pecten maximus TaxID=6579 RepID=UPI001458F960|nr:potassium voltage-gated channel protein egl-36-like [Pecten maximus]